MKIPNLSNKNLLIVLSFIFLLSACSSGGSKKSTSNAMPNMFGQSSTEPRPDAQSERAALQSVLEGVLGQDSKTLFGSVVQSIGVGISDPSGVDTTFNLNDNRFTLQVDRKDGSSTKLDTDSDNVYVVTAYPSDRPNPVTNRPAADGYIYKINNAEFAATGVFVEWSNTDPTDYLAGGYWAHASLATQGVEIGAFIDGPAYDGNVDLPVTGAAIYNGIAGGLYASSYGTDAGSLEGTFVGGEYSGDLTLDADFGTKSISGNIHNINLDGVSSDYGLNFGSTPINPDGQFEGDGITVTHPRLNITDSSGSWAGKFSTIDDSSGNPRGVAGTHKGSLITNGGTEAVFVGAHYGVTERFD